MSNVRGRAHRQFEPSTGCRRGAIVWNMRSWPAPALPPSWTNSSAPPFVARREEVRALHEAYSAVEAGATHTCGLTTEREAYCWGTNVSGELGSGSPSGLEPCPIGRYCSPRPLAVLGGLVFRSLQAGGGHSCGATAGVVAFCWGRNDQGQVGDGTTDRRRRPRRVAAPS